VNPPRLTAHATLHDDVLVLEYALENTTGQRLFAMNFVPDVHYLVTPDTGPPYGPMPYTTALAMVSWAGRDIVCLLQGEVAMDVPEGVNVYAPLLPDSTRLDPGETAEVTVRLRLPLVEWDLYHAPRGGRDLRAMTVRTLRFAIDGLFDADKYDPEQETETAGSWSVSGAPVHRWTVDVPLPRPCELWVRPDGEMPRFG
jgi:hypothetical protein